MRSKKQDLSVQAKILQEIVIVNKPIRASDILLSLTSHKHARSDFMRRERRFERILNHRWKKSY